MELYTEKSNKPWISLAILIGLTFVCSFAVQIPLIIGFLIRGVASDDFKHVLGNMNESGILFDGASAGFMYALFAAGSIGTFLLPAILLQWIERKQEHHYFYKAKRNLFLYLILSFLFLLASNPIMALVSEWNMNIKLPESMSDIEAWMRQEEDKKRDMIMPYIMTDSFPILLVNIFIFAVLPAIGEEYFFRGGLQGIMTRWFKNTHLAIWVVAIIFSTIHFQFYGFFPRLLLGAMFGYMFLWSKNIWVPIFAHFVNNASVTIIAFYYHSQGKSYDEMMAEDSYHMSLYFIGALASLVIGIYFYKIAVLKRKELDGTRLG